MARRGKNVSKTDSTKKPIAIMSRRQAEAAGGNGLPAGYWKACEFARDGHYKEARREYARLERSAAKGNARLRVLIRNDLAVLPAMEGKLDEASDGWREALGVDGGCQPARLNLGLVEAEIGWAAAETKPTPEWQRAGGEIEVNPKPEVRDSDGAASGTEGSNVDFAASVGPPTSDLRHPPATRVAVLSFLFNWPSTAGGNMHPDASAATSSSYTCLPTFAACFAGAATNRDITMTERAECGRQCSIKRVSIALSGLLLAAYAVI